MLKTTGGAWLRIRADNLAKVDNEDGASLSIRPRTELVAGFPSTLNDAHEKFPAERERIVRRTYVLGQRASRRFIEGMRRY
jgi:hypothetical protein